MSSRKKYVVLNPVIRYGYIEHLTGNDHAQ
jgi:hypothetical protein